MNYFVLILQNISNLFGSIFFTYTDQLNLDYNGFFSSIIFALMIAVALKVFIHDVH